MPSSEFDDQEAKEIERLAIAAVPGGGGASGRGGVRQQSTVQKVFAENENRVKLSDAVKKRKVVEDQKEFKLIERRLVKERKDKARKEITAKKEKLKAVIEARKTGLPALAARGGELVKSSITGVVIGLIPAPALRIAAAIQQGAAIAGPLGGVISGVVSAGVQLGRASIGVIAARHEEQQELIRRRRGIETLQERKARALSQFTTTKSLPAFIGSGTEIISIKIKEEITSKYLAFERAARSFGMVDGAEFALAMAGLSAVSTALRATTESAAKFFGKVGIKIPILEISREDQLRASVFLAVESGNVMALTRDTESTFWETMGVNTHPAAGVLMDEMRSRINLQLAGKGFSGGWKKEPPTPEQEK